MKILAFFYYLTICPSFHVNNTKFWLGTSRSLKVKNLATVVVTKLSLLFDTNTSLTPCLKSHYYCFGGFQY